MHKAPCRKDFASVAYTVPRVVRQLWTGVLHRNWCSHFMVSVGRAPIRRTRWPSLEAGTGSTDA